MKTIRIHSLLALCCILGGCAISNNQNNGSSESNEINTRSENNSESSKVELPELEPNTPQSWIDLFTFTNVTIKFSYNSTLLTEHTYKCVDGKWRGKDGKDGDYYEFDGRNIYDIYLCHYSMFKYDNELKRYSGEACNFDDTGYLHDVTIDLDENNRIKKIVDDQVFNSSEFISYVDFYDYGVTQF